MAMSKSLVIVESPAKAKTIEKYLGKGFEVLASVGHIMDLPKNDIGVELANRTFEPTALVSRGKEKVVAQLKRAAAKADEIFLAPDPDREGEAIAYHLALQLGTSAKERKKIRRVTFNEITKKAVQEAFKHARELDPIGGRGDCLPPRSAVGNLRQRTEKDSPRDLQRDHQEGRARGFQARSRAGSDRRARRLLTTSLCSWEPPPKNGKRFAA